jgi:putative membrane-bound dehydrogenase-like protein
MKRLALTSIVLALAASGLQGDAPKQSKTHQVRLGGHTFTLPAGFDIELVAGPPLVDRPITADFDEDGRLYVSDSSGSNENVQLQLKKKPHRILRLEDTHGTGKFDKRTVFADHMMFPEGTLWYKGSLYVSAVPVIWKLTDTDGDGVADQRAVWFDGKTLTGCANDLHGPYLGPDGWIYWCKGAFAPQTYERPGRKPLVTRAAHIFRARPDGSGVEPVMTGGMDNPVDVTFTPGGERVFTCTFLQHPGGGRRDGLIHAVYGGVYGKDWDVVYEHPWTAPSLMPVLAHLGAAAPCGLTRYESTAFGPEYKDNLFACLFNMQKVTRQVLTPDGATFTCRTEDFLVSDNKDFHPTDVQEDADGSLIVVDTGGWYKLCCPTSQLYKPDVLGAIYRVRRAGAPRVEDPRGRKLAWATLSPAELAKLLDDPRPAVRRRAIQTLADRGPDAVPALAEVLGGARSVEARRNAVWSATRIDHADARSAVRRALADADATVRQAALHSVSVRRDREALPQLLEGLKNYAANVGGDYLPQTKPGVHVRTANPFAGSPQNVRAAAEALGRIGDRSAVPALLGALNTTHDRVLEHSLTFALIEIGDAKGTAAGLHSDSVDEARGALVALDQMGAKLEPPAVTTELTSSNPKMKEAAWWIVGRHPEWGGALAGFLRQRLTAKDATDKERKDLARNLAKLARGPAVQRLLAEQLGDASAPPPAHRVALRAMAQAGLKQAPAAWVAALTQALAAGGDLLPDAVATTRALRINPKGSDKLTAELLRVARDEKAPADVRLGALAAVPGGLSGVEPPLFAFLRARLGPDESVARRTTAADVLARARLRPEQLAALADGLKSAGPMEVNRLVDAFAQANDEALGLRLVKALKAARARASLRPGQLRECLAKYGPRVQKEAAGLYAELNVGTAEQKAKLDALLPRLKGGDVRRGQAVFNSAKAACSACHAIGYLGGNVGPDLTHIGKIRTERDLLESIVFPSASFVRSYEPVVVTTRDGKVYNGVIRRDAADELVLATGPNQEARLAREEIEEVQPSRVSVMPAGLDQQLSPQDLADLVAFLKACQ